MKMNRRQKYARAGKSGKAHFPADLIFLPSFRWRQFRRTGSPRRSRCGEGGSKPVKVNQTSSLGQARGRNPCKVLTMNNLQNKQPPSSQTGVNLVNMVKISQSASSTHGGARLCRALTCPVKVRMKTSHGSTESRPTVFFLQPFLVDKQPRQSQ